MVFLLAIFAVGQGVYFYFFKRIQQDHVRRVSQSIFFVALSSLFQVLFLLILPPWRELSVNKDILPLSALFVVFYAAGAVLLLKALSLGSMSLTNVITIIRNFVPIVVGLVIWNEAITWNLGLGIVVFAGAIILINLSRGTGDYRKPLPQWVICSIAAGLCSGVAMCFSKQYGLWHPESPKEFLLAFNALVVLIAAPYVLYHWKSLDWPSLGCWPFMKATILVSFAQAVINIIYMIYIHQFSSAVFFPLIAVMGVFSSAVVGRICFKERIGAWGVVGIGMGIASVVLLNI